ncbi:MAG: CHAT domain-containing protein [Rhodomicrobium sp.]
MRVFYPIAQNKFFAFRQALRLLSVFLVLHSNVAGPFWGADCGARAQGLGEDAQEENRLAQFQRLIQRAAQGTDLEDKRAAAMEALAMEPTFRHWTLPVPRELVRAALNGAIGLADVDRVLGDRAENLEAAISALEASLTYLTKEQFPTEWGTAKTALGVAMGRRIKGDRGENQASAISLLNEVLAVFTRESNPEMWARAKMSLGCIFITVALGDQSKNLDSAIEVLQEAQTVYTREAFPKEWAGTQANLGVAYAKRITGSRKANLEEAIRANLSALEVYTKESAPNDWALAQHNLGLAYKNRIAGDDAQNVEMGIAALEAALTVRSREGDPDNWASTQIGIGNAYLERVFGHRSVNIELAIKAYESALEVATQESRPVDWALAMSNLGRAYTQRTNGNRAENYENALKALGNSLKIQKEDTLPIDWANTQSNLGLAYLGRSEGEAAENYEKAILAFESALRVYSKKGYPFDWARVQSNIGNVYQNRIAGDSARNKERSLEAYKAALEVYTKENFPRDWARTVYNIGIAYQNRIRGSASENRKKAIAAFSEALSIFTRDKFPREYLQSKHLLGTAYLSERNWNAAKEAFTDARFAFLDLLGLGLEIDDASDLIDTTGSMFNEWAFAAIESGQEDKALDLISEGRARMMALALKQQQLDLNADKLDRVNALRSEINEWSRRIEEPGEEGAQAIQFLGTVQKELGQLLAEGVQNSPGTNSLALASRSLPSGGALVVPILTDAGGKILIVARAGERAKVSVINLPGLTPIKLRTIVWGQLDAKQVGGWFGAYNVQYLSEIEYKERKHEWFDAINNIGPELWQLFGAATEKELHRLGVGHGARLILLPSGPLGLLPLGLAENVSMNKRFAELYEFVEVPSLVALSNAADRASKRNDLSLAAIINPTGEIERLALPFTEIEGSFVASHFPIETREIRTKSNASPEAALGALAHKTYWHISSHGFFDWSDARQAGLLMRDEKRLTVEKIQEQRGILGQPRLVVLSACETGIYSTKRNAEEFVGLPATFMELGAGGVLATLWQVDDLATSLLMARFYDLHIEQGLTPPAALRAAQIWLRTSTDDDIRSYIRDQAKNARIEQWQLEKVEEALKRSGKRSNSRFDVNSAFLQPSLKTGRKKGRGSVANFKHRPFEHPYYWGAFVYMGL